MKQQIKFDVNLITRIRTTLKREIRYKWLEATSAKPAFWPWNRKKAYPEGFYWNGRQSNDDYIDMEKAKKNYIVTENEAVFKVYEKPNVYVSLYKCEDVSCNFNSDEEAIEWVNMIAEKTGKTFENAIIN